MKHALVIFLISLTSSILHSCMFGADPLLGYHDLPGNLELYAMHDIRNMTIWEDQGDGISHGVMKRTVYAVGWNENFVIAKTHPDLTEDIELYDTTYYQSNELRNQNDSTLYNDKLLFKKDGKWYLKTLDLKPEFESLFPYKDSVIFHIVDIKQDNKHYELETKIGFEFMRKKLQILDTLTFFLEFEELK